MADAKAFVAYVKGLKDRIYITKRGKDGQQTTVLLRFPPLQETRWCAKFSFFKYLQENFLQEGVQKAWQAYRDNAAKEREQQCDDALANGMPLPPPITRTSNSPANMSILEDLKVFLIATRMCEASGATMFTLLSVLGNILPTLEKLRKKSDAMNTIIETALDRMVSKPLVITAFLSPVCRLADVIELGQAEDFNFFAAVVARKWLNGTLLKGVYNLVTREPARGLPAQIRPPRFQRDEMSSGEIRTFWKDWMHRDSPELEGIHHFLNAIESARPSEAEVERLFRKVKLTSTKERSSLNPWTVETLLLVNYFMSAK